MRSVAIIVALALLPAAGQAQQAAPAAPCAAMDQKLPADLEAWTAKAPLTAATAAAALPGSSLTPGKAVLADLPPASAVNYLAQPQKRSDPATHGGLFELKIAEAGTYAVALGSGGWIDLIKDGKPLASTTHSHGPACSTIHKVVDFQLAAGRYVLQVSGSPEPKTAILVTKRP